MCKYYIILYKGLETVNKKTWKVELLDDSLIIWFISKLWLHYIQKMWYTQLSSCKWWEMFLKVHFTISEYSSIKLNYKLESDIIRNSCFKVNSPRIFNEGLHFFLKHRKCLKLALKTKTVYNPTSSLPKVLRILHYTVLPWWEPALRRCAWACLFF